MFKAFTDNISSFIGNTSNSDSGGETQQTTAGATDAPLKDDNGGSSAAAGEVKSEVGATDTKSSSTDTSNEESTEPPKTSKVPPPRPKPPLSAATSINKEADDHQQHDVNASDVSSNENCNQETGEETEKKEGDKLDEVAEKAKAWGSYLFSMTKSAGASVGAKAMELKKVVAENTILGDFVKEQDKFVSAKKERARANEAAVPPWVGYNEEEQMKTQMFNLSADKRNFLRNPPTGVQFHFDYETCYPVAMATLAEDPRLQEMRFKLVPKQVSEHDFWRNYFYRVSLIKQSTQLTSLAKQSSSAGNADASPQSTQSKQELQPNAEEKPAAVSEQTPSVDVNEASNDDADTAGANDEFISDAYNLEITDEDLMKEMEALRASPAGDDEWEEELQKELTDFEVVGEEGGVDDAALEKAILNEMSSSDLK